MIETIISDKVRHINKNLFKYSQELVMLNYVYERKFLTKEEMVVVKQDIMKSYGVKNSDLFGG
jgi:hypothetical protein